MEGKLSKAIISSLVLAIIALASGIVSNSTLAGKQKITPHQLTVFFTGDDCGNIKPCG